MLVRVLCGQFQNNRADYAVSTWSPLISPIKVLAHCLLGKVSLWAEDFCPFPSISDSQILK